MRLQILTDGVDQAVSLAENSNTVESKRATLEILRPEYERLAEAIALLDTLKGKP
jgi:hypothetical protein